MNDRRLTPANAHVAATALRDRIDAPSYVDGTPARISQPVVDLLSAPGGTRDRQCLLGQEVTLYDTREGWAFVQRRGDDYVGYLPDTALTPADSPAPTHRVATRATHAYAEESMKSPDLRHLSFGSQLCILDERRYFYETPQGFVPKRHLRPLDHPFTDPVPLAMLFFGTPYLWGGNSSLGIDCSGLIQAALSACDHPCPADSDLQEAALGHPIDSPARGDLIFWKGHVALMADDTTLIHANAHHMAVAYEPYDQARLRIEAQGDGPVTSIRRLG